MREVKKQSAIGVNNNKFVSQVAQALLASIRPCSDQRMGPIDIDNVVLNKSSVNPGSFRLPTAFCFSSHGA